MARIETIEPEDFAPQLASVLGNPGNADRVALGSMVGWARRPEVAAAFVAFQRALHGTTTLRPRLLELLRLRVAFHNQCRSCMAVRSAAAVDDGMDEVAVCSLERPYEAPNLTDGERAALRYADLMAGDHLAIDDEVFSELRAHFSEDEIVELGIHVGICVGFGRLAASWDLVDDLSDQLRSFETRATPWDVAPVLR